MIVVDASVVIEALLGTDAAEAIIDRLFVEGETLHVPHLIDLEVVQVLRRYTRSGVMSLGRSNQALSDFAAMPLHRHPHDLLLSRIWRLRDHITAYDAAYVALAQALETKLLTRDKGLAATPLRGLPIELI